VEVEWLDVNLKESFWKETVMIMALDVFKCKLARLKNETHGTLKDNNLEMKMVIN